MRIILSPTCHLNSINWHVLKKAPFTFPPVLFHSSATKTMPRDEKLVGCGWMGEWHDELQSADIFFYGPPQAMGLSATLSTVYIYVCGRWVEVDQTGLSCCRTNGNVRHGCVSRGMEVECSSRELWSTQKNQRMLEAGQDLACYIRDLSNLKDQEFITFKQMIWTVSLNPN